MIIYHNTFYTHRLIVSWFINVNSGLHLQKTGTQNLDRYYHLGYIFCFSLHTFKKSILGYCSENVPQKSSFTLYCYHFRHQIPDQISKDNFMVYELEKACWVELNLTLTNKNNDLFESQFCTYTGGRFVLSLTKYRLQLTVSPSTREINIFLEIVLWTPLKTKMQFCHHWWHSKLS